MLNYRGFSTPTSFPSSCLSIYLLYFHHIKFTDSAATATTWLVNGLLIANTQTAAARLSNVQFIVHVTKRSLGLWPPSLPESLSLSPVAPWECKGWNDTQWLTVAQGPGFWPWLAGSVWQLVSPLPSFWPAASTVVVVGLIRALLWSLTLWGWRSTAHCYPHDWWWGSGTESGDVIRNSHRN